MKTNVAFLVFAVALALTGGNRLGATEPPPAVKKGKVLILKNEHTMEGDIERVGDRYRVRRAVGETYVPADRVLCLVASMPDAYVYLRSRINTEDADERLRLARWCRMNGLREQTLRELRTALMLRPDHPETRRLLERMQQEASTETAPKSTGTKPTPKVQEELPPVEVTTESLTQFSTRVQPILMNTCASCHATGHGGKFHLTQAYEDSLGNRRTVERNLTAVLRQVNLNQPEASRLLTYAVIDHGHSGQSPLRDRQAAPYKTLDNWVKLTVANNPHLRDVLPCPPAVSAPSSAMPPVEGRERHSASEASEWGADARPTGSPNTPIPPAVPPPTPANEPNKPAAAPASPAQPADPYDPEPFNQRTHPEASKPGPHK